MKVGLLTVHCSKNPGASLQAHALSKKITELGGTVEVINYCPCVFLGSDGSHEAQDMVDERKNKGYGHWSYPTETL